MTASSIVRKGRFSKRHNKKDAPRRQTFKPFGFWGIAGFLPLSPQKWSYTNRDILKCPVFNVTETSQHIAATMTGGEVSETFGPNDHAEVKRWLDDQILIVKRFEADADGEPLDWQPAGIEIDIDDFMADIAA